jgi:thiamine biosynthesis lipoprotein
MLKNNSNSVVLARHAMATRFEIVLPGENAVALRAAGEEALDEIDRLEQLLSLYRPSSDVAQLNARASQHKVRVTRELFALLERARSLSAETHGAFDITLAPLLRCWGLMGETGKVPTQPEIDAARNQVGMDFLELDSVDCTVHFAKAGMMLDFGAIGKGYAIERAVLLLREAGVTSALLHGGTSTVYGLGLAPDGHPWKVAIEYPSQDSSATPMLLSVVNLCDQALSVSAVWGKSFAAENKVYGHVLDPQTGAPVARGLLAAVVVPNATESDALSTALLAGGTGMFTRFEQLRPGMPRILLEQDSSSEDGLRCIAHGIQLRKRG